MTASNILLKVCALSLIIGLAVAQGQGQEHRKPHRNYRTRPTARVTTEAPTSTKEDLVEKSDVETSDKCPEPDGFFADAEQCDKYYACNDGKITEKLCPDGQVFNDYASDQEKCDLPFNIDCSKRSNLQEPKPSPNCPRLHGYFGHKDRSICDKFYYCVDGQFNMITCPDGLVFNPKTGICTWPDEAQKKGCLSEDIFNFSCPKVTEDVAATHPRYADPDDCQYFYVCVNGEKPRRSGCKLGQVFDDSTKRCDWARTVPECADWYKDRLTDKQLHELEHPTTKAPKSDAVKVVRRRKPARKQQRQEEAEE